MWYKGTRSASELFGDGVVELVLPDEESNEDWESWRVVYWGREKCNERWDEKS